MIINIIFYFLLILYSFVIFASVSIGVLYYLQLDGYNKKSILKSLLDSIKVNYLNIIFYLLILIFMSNPHELHLLELFFILNLECVFIVLLGSRFAFLHKLKYTKRMIRLMSVMVLLFGVLQIVVCSIFPLWVMVLFLPINILLAYLFSYCSLVILIPVERKISSHYLDSAKVKLNDHHNLIKVAITGSYGKTSTKEILNSILSESSSVLATEKSFNTPNGISLTINNKLKNTHEIFVCEMGARARGEIKELCEFVAPDIGVVVSVGRQHMKTFGSIENVYATKKELPDYLSNKRCVFNLDNKYVRQMFDVYNGNKIGVFLIKKHNINIKNSLIKKRLKIKLTKKINPFIFFSCNKSKMVYAKRIMASDLGLQFDIYYNNEFLLSAKSYLIGIHNVTNILLAVAVGVFLDVDATKMGVGIEKLQNINARLQKIIFPNGAILLNNGYNSNLDSAISSLKTLQIFNRRNKVVITPGLIECADEYKDNYEFAKLIAKFADKVYIVGLLNAKALKHGLIDGGFSEFNIISLNKMSEIYIDIEKSDDSYVYLIENDLPENYR